MSVRNEGEKVNITVFGPETEFDGILEFNDKLVLTGKFTGKIIAPNGDLHIAKNAVCNAEKIEARSIVVSGSVKGDLFASERVEICSGSVVDSNISTARIRIAKNVEFSGEIDMMEDEPDIDLFSVASSEYKKALVVRSDLIK